MARLTVDGRPVEVADGATVLQAASDAGVRVPTLCADPRLSPSGACRLCLVEVTRPWSPATPTLVAACATTAADGMVVETGTEELTSFRRSLLGMLTDDYPNDVVAAVPDEPFHLLLDVHGVTAHGGPRPATSLDRSHPLFDVDLSRCVSCWRCVQVCEDLQGCGIWRINGRGAAARIVAGRGSGFGATACVSCGACIDACPTGALQDRTPGVHAVGRPTAWTRTTCPYCGVGCELQVGTDGGRIVTVVPAVDAPANRGHACVKGRSAYGFVTAADRVTAPMIRENGAWTTVSWDEAIAAAARQLRAAVERGGPGAVGVLGSARATNEENYLVQKLARAVLGTNNVDCCARVCHAPSAVALRNMLGTGAATSSYADIDLARTILVCGTNTTENHPVVGARIVVAARRGARLVVIDPRGIELSGDADVHLRPLPGTNVALLNAIAAAIVEEDLVDHDFVAGRVDRFDDFAAHVREYRPEAVAPLCGVDAADIRAAARLYATARPAISFHGLGVTEHHRGTEGVMALVNLALLTGNIGRPGTGVNPLRGQNNVQGSAHMGCEPSHLPGYVPIDVGRSLVESVWGAPVPTDSGLDAMHMLDAAAAGRLRALYVVGWDIAQTQPDMHATDRALAALDSVVVQDLFLNETARRFGTVFLPAAASFEKDGTFMSSERRVQRVRAAVPAPGGALPDWRIVCELAAALGGGELFRYDGPEQIWDEVRQVWAPGAGVTYRALDEPGGRQWPCPGADHPGTALLHTAGFATADGRASLALLEYVPSPELTEATLPFVLVTGRTLAAFNAGTMTSRSATAILRPTDVVEVHPDDAAELGLRNGRPVRLVSRYGEAVVTAEVVDRVPRGVVFATFHDPAVALNRVTGPHRDRQTHTPAYKRTAVRLEPLPVV